MNALPQTHFTVDDFLAWSESQPGRYELVDGVVVAQAAERASHAKMKLAVCVVLRDAIARRGASCHVLPDGIGRPGQSIDRLRAGRAGLLRP